VAELAAGVATSGTKSGKFEDKEGFFGRRALFVNHNAQRQPFLSRFSAPGCDEELVWLRPSEFSADGRDIPVFAKQSFEAAKTSRAASPSQAATARAPVTTRLAGERRKGLGPQRAADSPERLVQPDDIVQGELGDCYFLAALACLAEHPEMVLDLIVEEHASLGLFGGKFFKEGAWTVVVVDDRFPCRRDKHTGEVRPLFSHDREGDEIWVMVLEKAWAKLHGSYEGECFMLSVFCRCCLAN
jgi:hypothetical protein